VAEIYFGKKLCFATETTLRHSRERLMHVFERYAIEI